MMIARTSRARSGITLTEILISILIMGVGLISLATLFPLGLIRLREATRQSRSGLANETAADDIDARSLLYKPSFMQTWSWITVTVGTKTITVPRDPFVQDVSGVGASATTAGILASAPYLPNGQNSSVPGSPPPPLLQNGLPICYDPLWRSITGVYPNTALADSSLDFVAGYAASAADEARFGAGLFAGSAPFIRNDPNDSTNTNPSAHGLQRLTNFIPWSSKLRTPQYPFTAINFSLTAGNQPSDVAGDVFSSIDDIVFNAIASGPNSPSSVLPDMSAGAPQADYRFTWFFTGRQTDAGGNGSQFTGEIVVCDGRPFGFDPIPGAAAGVKAPAGETVVEAIYGVAGAGFSSAPTTDFSPSDRTVMLRWPATMPDPQVKVGGWICDVTYERDTATYGRRLTTSLTSFARCNWYQVGRKTDPEPETSASSAPVATNYRRMILTITSPLRARTLLNVSDGSPVHVNVALVMPSVINVFPRAFEVH